MFHKFNHYVWSAYRLMNYSRILLFRKVPSLNNGIDLNFDLNDGCNIDCVMCCKKNSFATQHFISIERFRSSIARAFSVVDDFQFGCQFEPLMYPHFEEAVQCIGQHLRPGSKGGIICNGTLLNEHKRNIIISSEVFRKIRISFDGAEKVTFEAIRRGAKFDLVVSNIAALVSEKNRAGSNCTIGLNFTVMKQNISELPNLIKLASDLGIDSVSTHKLFPEDYGIIDNAYHETLIENMQKSAQLASETGIEFTGQTYCSLKNADKQAKVGNKACGFLQEPLLFILAADGTLSTPCRQLVWPLGNLLREDFESICQSNRFACLMKCFVSTCERICKKCYMYYDH